MSSDKLTDKVLVLKSRLGNKEAFGTLYNKYINKIYRFAFYKTSSKELAEDIASQSFLKLWEKIAQGGPIQSVQALLYQIARNLIIDHYRSKYNTEVPLEFELDSQAVHIDEKIHSKIDNELLRPAVMKLKEEYREVVVLRYIEELSISEIAKIVDKSNGNVRTLTHRALAELKKILKDYNLD
ncbi:MAG: RNA polymerase sigma factor [Candidatus Komeilibacteria bacterium]